MILTAISPLEWVIMGLMIASLITYVIYSVYRKKHPKKKEEEDE